MLRSLRQVSTCAWRCVECACQQPSPLPHWVESFAPTHRHVPSSWHWWPMIYLSGHVNEVCFEGRADIGLMLTPRMWNKTEDRIAAGATPWGADTGCYSATGHGQFDLDEYVRWLTRKSVVRRHNLFATAPDVYGKAQSTLERAVLSC